MDDFFAELRKIPPVTRLLCGSTIAVSVPLMLQILSPYKILFVKELVLRQFEIWRIYTSFFYGGSGINFIFEFAMLYRNSDSVESTHFVRRSGEYAYQLSLACLSILALNIPLKTFIHFRPLLICLTYLVSRLTPDARMSLFGIISLRNLYLPYVLVVLDFVMGGPQAAIQSLTGLITGHMWYFLEFSQGEGARGTVLGRAPRWLKKWLGDEDEVRPPGGSNAAAHVSRAPVTTPYGTAIPPRRREQPAGSESGHSWTGTGQRLGTE